MRCRAHATLRLIPLATFWLMAGPSTASPLFVPLGDLPGGSFGSSAYDVSSDGSVVVGSSSTTSGSEAFRWTQADGMVGLGDLPGGLFHTRAFGVSGDGTVIVGQGSSASGYEAFRWTQADGMVGLGDLPGGDFESRAYDVSGDGMVVVGWSISAGVAGVEAFRWTQTGGMLPLLAGVGGEARAVSDDGSVVVGWRETAEGREAFLWTEVGEVVGLADLPGGPFGSEAWDVSNDGLVVAGHSYSGSDLDEYGLEAFRWTQADGMVGLGDLPWEYINSQAYDVSGDGSVVVGQSESSDEAFIWDATHGMRRLEDVLVAMGLDLTGWTLTSAEAVSDDGLTIVGRGINPGEQPEAWLAHIPEPSSEFLLALGIAALVGLKRTAGVASATRGDLA